MKKLIISFLIIFFLINEVSVSATSKMPMSFVPETTIAGIVPIDDDISVNMAIFDLDFNTNNGLDVTKGIEKRADLKMTYNLIYSGNKSSVRFSLPILSKLKFLGDDVNVFVDGNKIEPFLNISTKHTFMSFEHSYTRMVEQDFLTDYRENMFEDYLFIHDVDGYLYTVKNPKTEGDNYYVNTKLRFIDVPADTVFVDISGDESGNDVISYGTIRKSEEEYVFFSSSELMIEAECIEVIKSKQTYHSYDKRLDDPKISKQEMKLSKYFDEYSFENHRFLESIKKLFYYNIDQKWSDNDKFHIYRSKSILNDIYDEYLEMSLDFDINFSKPQIQVEIEMPIPIHCYKEDMTIEFVGNPGQKFKEFDEFSIHTHIDEKIIKSNFEPNSNENKNYYWIIDGNSTLTVNFTNSSYRNPFGIVFLRVFIMILIIIFIAIVLVALGVFLIIYLIRPKKNKIKQRI